jgi:hypothetical protein
MSGRGSRAAVTPAGLLTRGDWVLRCCWLGCGDEDLPVRWLGPARLRGPDGDADVNLYGCAWCVDRLYRKALNQQPASDLGVSSFNWGIDHASADGKP